jgi:hypothetical protein
MEEIVKPSRNPKLKRSFISRRLTEPEIEELRRGKQETSSYAQLI